MESIVEEKLVSFKELEQKIYRYVCELGREITQILLERYDTELLEKSIQEQKELKEQNDASRQIIEETFRAVVRFMRGSGHEDDEVEAIKPYLGYVPKAGYDHLPDVLGSCEGFLDVLA